MATTKPTATEAALLAKIEALEAKLAAKNGNGHISFKVSEKGGVSVYGVGRFPVTLYETQWNAIIEKTADLKAFMKDHAKELAHKDDNH